MIGDSLMSKKIKLKKFVRVISDHCIWGKQLDFLCDNCGTAMRPGGHFQMDFDGLAYQFCSENCMDTYVPKPREVLE
jgi:YHS domain-containing protein